MMRFTVYFRERTVGLWGPACLLFSLASFVFYFLFSFLVKEIVMRPAK